MAPAAPGAGWNVAVTSATGMTNGVNLTAGSAWWPLLADLDAHLPRAVAVDVAFTGVNPGQKVLLLALAGSSVDDAVAPITGAPVTVADLARAWPYAALRIVNLARRV